MAEWTKYLVGAPNDSIDGRELANMFVDTRLLPDEGTTKVYALIVWPDGRNLVVEMDEDDREAICASHPRFSTLDRTSGT